MLVLAVLLSWIPVVGPLVAGVVGGRMIGGAKRALAVALIPAVALAVLIVAILALFDLPVLGAVAGFAAFVVVAVQEVPLLVGAYAGGALVQR